ncbi:MAG: J domain-containing protein [Treponema sp.]|jgi:DnaJ like chaperone protein|nr:J domain-containing protein [Treponema sp.]
MFPGLNSIKRLIRSCPPWLRVLGGSLIGGFIGLLGGLPGLVIGLILGAMVRELFSQFRSDREVIGYYDNPGKTDFYEGEPGLAAWCALGVLISGTDAESGSGNGEAGLEQTIRMAKVSFPGPNADRSLIEHFCRLARSRRETLNPDLLAESLASRRKTRGDLPFTAQSLYSLAPDEKARNLAEQICGILDPSFKVRREEDSGGSGKTAPWKILDLPPGTPLREVKSHFRKLAAQFHPDSLQALNEEQREIAARAFIAIEEAYREIVEWEKACMVSLPASPDTHK